MNSLFFLVWLTMSSCTFVDAKLWGHKEEAEATAHGAAAHVKEKVCEAADKVCHDERARFAEAEAEGRMAHAAHTVKDKLNEAVHHVRGERESEELHVEHKRHLHTKESAAEAGLSAAAALHHAKERMAGARDSAMEGTRHAGEKVKHGFEEAYDSTTSGLKSAKDKAQHQANSAYEQASAKASEAGDYVKGKLWTHTEKPVGFMHLYFPGFHSWLAIFTAIAAQMALGWAWYGFLFRKPFLQALREDRLINVGAFQSFSAMPPGVSDKLYQAGHYVKDSAVAGKLSDAAHKFSNSAAGQKLSQAGEYVRDKAAVGTASIQNAAHTMKDKAEQTAYQAKEKMTHAAHSAQESAAATANQASEKIRDSAVGQKMSQTAENIRESDTAQKLSQTAQDAKERIAGATANATSDTTYVAADATTGADFATGPYSVMWGPFASLFTSIIRSFFMFHWLKVLMVHSMFGALAMAFAFFIGSQFCSMHHYIWEGRPLKLLLIDHGCELALNLATAFIVYHCGVAK